MQSIDKKHIEESINTAIHHYTQSIGEEALLKNIKRDGYLLLSVVFESIDKQPKIDFMLQHGTGWFVMPNTDDGLTIESLKKFLIEETKNLIEKHYLYFVRTNGSLSATYTLDWGYQYIKYHVGGDILHTYCTPELYESLLELGYSGKLNESALTKDSTDPKKALLVAASHLDPSQLNELMVLLDLPQKNK